MAAMAMGSASEVLEDALGFPMSDDDWVVTVLIGGLVTIAGILVLPIFVLQGFFVAVIRETLAGEDLPEWGEVGVGRLFVDGLKLTAVNLVYSLLVVVPFLVLAGGVGILGASAGGEGGEVLVLLGFLVLGLVLSALGLVVGYVVPAATVNFARQGSVGAAFDFEVIREVATSRDYLVGWLLALAVSVLVSIVMNVLGVVGIFTLGLGLLPVPWIAFFFYVSLYYIFAQAYAGGLDLDIPLPDVQPAEA